MISAAGAFEWDEWLHRIRLLLLLELELLLLLLQLLLQLADCGPIEGTLGDAAMLQSSAIEAWAIVIMALPDDFAAADNDAPVTVVQRRLVGLLQAEREILIRLHFAISLGDLEVGETN